MKNKKLFLPTVIILAAILAIAIIGVILGISLKPTVTEGKFPFSITYKVNGETVTIEDVYSAYNHRYTHTQARFYSGNFASLPENETVFEVKVAEDRSTFISPNFYADHLMGDPQYDYFDDAEFAPEILCYNLDGTECTDETHGIEIISWEYPTPLENPLVFSHIACIDSDIVWPSLIISILVLIAILIFVKKDEGLTRKPIDTISIVFNFLIMIFAVPFFSMSAWLLDALGSGSDIFSQIIYCIGSVTVLCVAASVALRRKGYRKSSLIVQFITIAIFELMLFLSNLGINI